MSTEETNIAKNAVQTQMMTPVSLRDYFAAAALQGELSGDWDRKFDSYAKDAYLFADAMLRAREPPQRKLPEPEGKSFLNKIFGGLK